MRGIRVETLGKLPVRAKQSRAEQVCVARDENIHSSRNRFKVQSRYLSYIDGSASGKSNFRIRILEDNFSTLYRLTPSVIGRLGFIQLVRRQEKWILCTLEISLKLDLFYRNIYLVFILIIQSNTSKLI